MTPTDRFDRIKWSSFDPNINYTRKYINEFYDLNSDCIEGVVLDIGAKKNEESRYREISDSIGRYIAVDLEKGNGLSAIADGRELPIKSESVDTVILSEVLEHVPPQDISTFLSEVYRVLEPDGTVLASTPFIHRLHGWPNDFSRLTPFGLQSIFESENFEPSITLGGGMGEILLHIVFISFKSISGNLIGKEARWLFFPIHLLACFIAHLLAVVLRIFGTGKRLERWHLSQFVRAKKEGTV